MNEIPQSVYTFSNCYQFRMQILNVITSNSVAEHATQDFKLMHGTQLS